jgi:hypothetical protein
MAGMNINTKKIGKAVYYLRIRQRILAEIDRQRAAYTSPDTQFIQDRGGYVIPIMTFRTIPIFRPLLWYWIAKVLGIRLSRREWRQVMR